VCHPIKVTRPGGPGVAIYGPVERPSGGIRPPTLVINHSSCPSAAAFKVVKNLFLFISTQLTIEHGAKELSEVLFE
jgi:hypothetical protein